MNITRHFTNFFAVPARQTACPNTDGVPGAGVGRHRLGLLHVAWSPGPVPSATEAVSRPRPRAWRQTCKSILAAADLLAAGMASRPGMDRPGHLSHALSTPRPTRSSTAAGAVGRVQPRGAHVSMTSIVFFSPAAVCPSVSVFDVQA